MKKNRDQAQQPPEQPETPLQESASGSEPVVGKADVRQREKADQDRAANLGSDGDTGSTQEATAEKDETTAEPDPVEARLKELEQNYQILSDKYLRLMAEYDNYRKRSQRERDALYGDHIIQFTREWLPVIDNLERAEKSGTTAADASAASICEGISLVLRQALDVLSRQGVEPIVAVGETFDPMLHEAVLHVEDSRYGVSEVIEEFVRGYRRDDKVIRHSAVRVAN